MSLKFRGMHFRSISTRSKTSSLPHLMSEWTTTCKWWLGVRLGKFYRVCLHFDVGENDFLYHCGIRYLDPLSKITLHNCFSSTRLLTTVF